MTQVFNILYKARSMEYFLSVIGMVLVIEALPYMAFPGKVKEVARLLETISNTRLQIIGLLLAFFGIIILFIARFSGEM